jgi:hypothetical protein
LLRILKVNNLVGKYFKTITMKLKLFTITGLFCCFFLCIGASTCVIDGKWSGAFKTTDGAEFPVTYTLKQVDGTIIGNSSFPKGSVMDGKLDGDQLSFKVPIYGSPIAHIGKFYCQADTIGIDIELSGKKLHATLKRDN